MVICKAGGGGPAFKKLILSILGLLLICILFFSFFQIDVQQVMVYCDPSLAIQEACCEIPGARVIMSV